MKGTFTSILLLLGLSIGGAVHADTVAGWQKSIDQNGAIVYKSDLESNALVKIYPPVLLENIGADAWLNNKLINSEAPRGEWAEDETHIIRRTANWASGHRTFTQPDGSLGIISGLAYTADRQYVRLGVYIGDWNDESRAVFREGMKIVATLQDIERATATEEQRGLDLENSPPRVNGLTTGGIEIKPGRYVGTRTRNNKVRDRYEVILYPNGQYEFPDKNDIGDYIFSAATGRLDMEGDFSNSTYDYHEEFCVYGIDDRSGKHTIIARDGLDSYRLTWTNEPDRPSPRDRIVQERAAKEEADRYKYVTSAGNGMQPEDIEAIVYTAKIHVGVRTGLESNAYVLMKDGRVMDNMPVAPDILDVATSRSREPDRWGFWKPGNEGVLFSWNSDGDDFAAPDGNQYVAQAIPRGTRIEGTWQTSKGTSSLDLSSLSKKGVRLSKNGRFQNYHSNSSLGGGESSGAAGPMVGVFSDEEGSQSVISGSNVGGGFKNTKDNPESNYQGQYEFDGYNLTLTYDSGKIERLLTFSVGDNFKTLWFGNSGLTRKSS